MLAQRPRVGADGEAEQQERRGAEDEDGDELRARPPLQQQVLAQGREEDAHGAAPPRSASAGISAAGPLQTSALPRARARGRRAAGRAPARCVAISTVAPRAPQLGEHPVEQLEPGRVQLSVGLVEQDDRGCPAAARAPSDQPLAHARREARDGIVGARRRARPRASSASARSSGRAQEARRDLEVLARGERLVQVRLVAEQRDRPPHPVAPGLHVVARHPRAAAVGTQRGGEHAQERRLARAVAAREHHDRALRARSELTSRSAQRRP